jgi:type IV pilus assembly protein PilW
MSLNQFHTRNQSGFTLVELMVGLVIGLMATLVIMQTLSAFEGQKRTTTGTADAQVNGSIALYNIQRQVQMAGYGLPIFDANALQNNSPLKCNPSTIDDDANNATAKVEIFPISIADGGAAGSDTITVRTFPTSTSGGLPVNVVTVAGSILGVDNNLGCSQNDIALVVRGTTCYAGKVSTTNANLVLDTTHITLTGPDVASMSSPARLSCLGSINTIAFAINANNELTQNGTPVISDVVSLQAQYGISANSTSNVITQWVDATVATGFATPTIANRNRIRAIRVAVVARNGLLEKTNVTSVAPIAWDPASANPTIASPAPAIDLTGNAQWQQYRYRVYETIIPLRNLTWSGQWL